MFKSVTINALLRRFSMLVVTSLKLQHIVGPYRVDMCMSIYNVVVECDEQNHNM